MSWWFSPAPKNLPATPATVALLGLRKGYEPLPRLRPQVRLPACPLSGRATRDHAGTLASTKVWRCVGSTDTVLWLARQIL